MKKLLGICLVSLLVFDMTSCADKDKLAVAPVTKAISSNDRAQPGIGESVYIPSDDNATSAQAASSKFCSVAVVYQNRNYPGGGIYRVAGQNIGYKQAYILTTDCGNFGNFNVVLAKGGVIVQILRTNWTPDSNLQVDQLASSLATGSDYQIAYNPVGTNLYSGGIRFTIYGSDTNIPNLITSPNGAVYNNPNQLAYNDGNVTVTWDTSVFGPNDLINVYVLGDQYNTGYRDRYRNLGTYTKVGSVANSQGSITFPLSQVNYGFGSGSPAGSRFRIRVEKDNGNSGFTPTGGSSTDNFVYNP